MARIVPAQLPKQATHGEERLFALLQQLPEDCVVYYEPFIGKRCPDFLLISPTQGLLIIEIKSWHAKDLIGGDSYSVVLQGRGQPVTRIHPVRQARDYMFKLMDYCRENLWCSPLLHPDGEFRGRFFFPFGHLAILTNIARDQLQRLDPKLSTLFPAETVVTKDELEKWSNNRDPRALLAELNRFFDPTWVFPPMLESQIDLLRCIIHPEIRLSVPKVIRPEPQKIACLPRNESNLLTEITQKSVIRFRTLHFSSETSASSVAEASPVQATSPPLTISEISLKAMDLQQEIAARNVGCGHRLIFGVAGSGKTVVLISRARLLALVAQRRVLILCFNVTLFSFLAKNLEDAADRVTVRHFDGLASEFDVRRQYRESHLKLGERLLERLRSGKVERVYDALMIDEAQDFDPSWFICAMQLLRDPNEADVLIVGDGNQGIYGQRRTPWSKLGISAKGRTTYFRKSYRSSKEIVQFAAPFASTEGREDDGVSPIAIDPAQATRSRGILPLLARAADRQSETDQVVELIGSMINGRFAGKQLAEALHPSDIAVLIPAIPNKLSPIFRHLCEQLSQRHIPYLWLNNPADREARKQISQNSVKLQSIHSSKGLQYKAVIVLWTDLLPNSQWDESVDEQRMLLYVALTRAEDYLCVSYSGESPFMTTLINTGRAQRSGH
jgi:hypothetical protein